MSVCVGLSRRERENEMKRERERGSGVCDLSRGVLWGQCLYSNGGLLEQLNLKEYVKLGRRGRCKTVGVWRGCITTNVALSQILYWRICRK